METLKIKSLLALLLLLLFASASTAVYLLLHAVTRKRRVIRLEGLKNALTEGRPPDWLAALCAIGTRKKDGLAEWKQLLNAAGIRLEPLWYLCLKRMLAFGFTAAALLAAVFRDYLRPMLPVHPAVLSLAAGAGAALMLTDRYMLSVLKRYRTNRMVEEIFYVCRQLLYFDGSPLHLHGKLARCLPYTKLIRTDWHLLLNEWYQDAEGAIRRFRDRLGTEEAHGFAETLQSLRLYDGEAYYGLIRQRVQDYKEKLELIRDSRKESASYGLFVLAGIPILYTFQIFIHPWVQEGIKLFNTLNG